MSRATSSNVRHILFRFDDTDLPQALVGALRDEVVTCGWIRGSGVIEDAEVALVSASGPTRRRLAGLVQVVGLEGSVGLVDGDVSCGLRALFSRETDLGPETFAGEIVRARVRALEVLVTALDDVDGERAPHPDGPWLLARIGPGRTEPAAPSGPTISREVPAAITVTVSNVAPRPHATAVADASAPRPAAPPSGPGGAIPPRLTRFKAEEAEQPVPEAGDHVIHFMFGRCEVVKSEDDRLHLRMGKDGKVKEIALEMLRVTPLPDEDGSRVYRLDRKM